MPGVIVLLLGAGAAWFGYRALNRAMERVTSDLKAAEADIEKRRDAGERLEYDPDTGVYRPRKSEQNQRD
jgi:hypothetical protein